MNKVSASFYKQLKYSHLIVFVLCLFASVGISQGSIEEGKTLFKNNCAACHNKNMKDNLVGPALAGTQERWADYPAEDLYSWIRNSQSLIAAGHPLAVELWNTWKPTNMTAFPNLTDDEVSSILLYIDDAANAVPIVAITGGGAGSANTPKGNSSWFYWILFLILAVVAGVLARIISNLNYISATKENPDAIIERPTLLQTLSSKGVIGFLIFALIIALGYTTVTNAIDLGRQQNYQPEQPIKFSHATHAGLNGINCQYCHDGARRSKHSVIPATNTCMNCHKAIKKGSIDGTQEISKIFASIGFNPNTDQYIENYDDLSEVEVKEIFTKWIGDEYMKDKTLSQIDEIGERQITNQWDNIKSSLTNPLKTKVQGPIEWIRIHHLPDHVYFNHAQHVTVGQLECQNCHGKVEEMEVLQQYAPLSMGWCINCHRQTEVKFTGNEYYDSYEKYHDALESGERDKVTVEDIGGIECQKCHY